MHSRTTTTTHHLRTAWLATGAAMLVLSSCSMTTNDDAASVASSEDPVPSIATTTSLDGVTAAGLPAEISYRRKGWSYRVELTKVPKLVASKQLDPSSPPGKSLLHLEYEGAMVGTVTSLDDGRQPPVESALVHLKYDGYKGPDFVLGQMCDNYFTLDRTSMGDQAAEGDKFGSSVRSPFLVCGDTGRISSDGSSVAPGGHTTDPVMSDASVESTVAFLEKDVDAVILDVGDGSSMCRFAIDDSAVSQVGDFCEVLAP